MRRALVAGGLLTALVLTGCGGDDDPATPTAGNGSADGSGLIVVAKDIEFPQDTYEAAAGEVEVTYRNEGSIVHTLLIEEVDGFELEVATNGDVDQGSVQLDAGTYTLYCDIPGHREAGMEATLEVS